MTRFLMRRLLSALCAAGMLTVSTQASASAFQLFEQDGGSYLANYHAGYAAAATDASTAFYNPAGITRFKNQQVVFSAINVLTDFKYKGNIAVNTIDAGLPMSVTAQGGSYAFVPALNYVAPISDYVGFGFSVVVPFGLKTDYGTSTVLRYAATETSVKVIDISPSLGFKVTNQLSLGIGFDIQRMFAEFDSVAGLGLGELDTLSRNKADDTAYGYHLGALYEFNPCSRLGFSYHSQVVHRLEGTSRFEGPLAAVTGTDPLTSHASTHVTLPAYATLSYYHKVTQPLALMASLTFTKWNVFQDITLNNVAGINEIGEPITDIQVTIPQRYRNTWNLAVGGEYNATDRITLRAGVGYDQTPLRGAYRDVRLPDNDRYIVALGGHFQATKCVGVDLGWLHVFFNEVNVNPVPQQIGIETVSTNGKASGGADVYGAQITWDIA